MDSSKLGEFWFRVLVILLVTPTPFLFIAARAGLVNLGVALKFVVIPLFVILLILLPKLRQVEESLYNQVVFGIVAGLLATWALDVVRLGTLGAGYFMGDNPVHNMGAMITGGVGKIAPAKIPLLQILAGYLYHYLNGISLTLPLFMLFGRVPWYGALAWAVLFVETGMMLSFGIIAPKAGLAGLKLGGGILWGSFMAHVAMGLAIGFISERYVKGGGIWHILFSSQQPEQGAAKPDVV